MVCVCVCVCVPQGKQSDVNEFKGMDGMGKITGDLVLKSV